MRIQFWRDLVDKSFKVPYHSDLAPFNTCGGQSILHTTADAAIAG